MEEREGGRKGGWCKARVEIREGGDQRGWRSERVEQNLEIYSPTKEIYPHQNKPGILYEYTTTKHDHQKSIKAYVLDLSVTN